MSDIPNLPEALHDKPGVAMSVPPPEIKPQVDSLIASAIANLASDKNGVFTAWIDNEKGINLATGVKVGNDIKVMAYYGKVWGKPHKVGVAVSYEF